MLSKDKKPAEKEAEKEAMEVVPPTPETPKLFKTTLKVAEQAGIEGTFAKLKKSYKASESSEVRGRWVVFDGFTESEPVYVSFNHTEELAVVHVFNVLGAEPWSSLLSILGSAPHLPTPSSLSDTPSLPGPSGPG